MVLLVSAGLLVRALWRIEATDPGFRTDGVLTLRDGAAYAEVQRNRAPRGVLHARCFPAVRALPGVSSAAYISFLPMTMTGGIWPVAVDGKSGRGADSPGRIPPACAT